MDDILYIQTGYFLKQYYANLLSLSDTKMVNRTICNFICECGEHVSIQYRLIIKRGAYCRTCCYTRSYNKRMNTVNNESYDNPCVVYMLKQIAERDKCIILNFNNNLSFKSIIKFKCNCGKDDSTLYRNIKIRGGICRECCCRIANNKRASTFMELYGAAHSSRVPEIIEKTKRTNIERYGTTHPAQSSLIECNTYKSKEYITKSGRKYIIQGYEDIALDELYISYLEDMIVIGKANVPQINYIFDNKEKIYYPDIFIPSENKIIEVKSTWTYKIQYNKNIIKANTCIEKGYKFEFWIYDGKMNKTILSY
jgi:hypothetical protein